MSCFYVEGEFLVDAVGITVDDDGIGIRIVLRNVFFFAFFGIDDYRFVAPEVLTVEP